MWHVVGVVSVHRKILRTLWFRMIDHYFAYTLNHLIFQIIGFHLYFDFRFLENVHQIVCVNMYSFGWLSATIPCVYMCLCVTKNDMFPKECDRLLKL